MVSRWSGEPAANVVCRGDSFYYWHLGQVAQI